MIKAVSTLGAIGLAAALVAVSGGVAGAIDPRWCRLGHPARSRTRAGSADAPDRGVHNNRRVARQ